MFRKREHKSLCRDVLMQVAGRHSIAIRSLPVGDDHVHLIATIPPTMSPNNVFSKLNDDFSWLLFRQIPTLGSSIITALSGASASTSRRWKAVSRSRTFSPCGITYHRKSPPSRLVMDQYFIYIIPIKNMKLML